MSNNSKDEKRREMHIERRRETTQPTRKKRVPRAQRKSVKKTPSGTRKNTPEPNRQDLFASKHSNLLSEINTLSHRTQNLPQSVNKMDNDIKEISSRIQNIRKKGYISQRNIDTQSTGLLDSWMTALPNMMTISNEKTSNLLQKANNIESNIKRANSIDDLTRFQSELSGLNTEFNIVENLLRGQLDDYQTQYQTIDKDLKNAEETMSNLENSSIGWKNNESPLLAVKIHNLTNDQQGVLTLTNYRILFEEIKEEVIKRNLFFATEKKTVRDTIIDQPIGSIDEIEKGRVGLFKGAGLYIKFKPQTGLDEIKIDTSGNEDDRIIYYYNHIVSGEADKELGPLEEILEDHIPVSCPTCSAPYSEEILKGQTSVKCIYCGSVIKV